MRWAVIGASSFSGGAFIRYVESLGDRAVPISMRDDADAIANAVRASGAQHVVNFAALNMVGESWAHAPDYFRVNVVKAAEVARAVGQVPGLRCYVNVSTPEVYGQFDALIDDAVQFNPSTPYALSRATHDAYLGMLFREFGFPVITMRTVNVYGPRQQLYRIVPRTIMAALTGRKLRLHGGGQSRRSFIHIDDHADAIRLAAVKGGNGRTYLTSGSAALPIREVVSLICELMGARIEDVVEAAPERVGKDPVYLLDDSRTRAELGWHACVNLQDGLSEVVGWCVDNFDTLKDQPLDYVHKP